MQRLVHLEGRVDAVEEGQQLLQTMHDTLTNATCEMTEHLREKIEQVEVSSKSHGLQIKNEQTELKDQIASLENKLQQKRR